MCYDTQLKEKFIQVGLEEIYKTYLDKDRYPVPALKSRSHIPV